MNDAGDSLFRTGEVSAEVRERAVASGRISVSGRAIQIALRLVSIAILARLLRPEDFGVRALVLPVIILTNSVINLRLHVAVLQQENLDSEGLGRVFRLSLRFNLLMVLIVAALGPLLAEIYDDARVVGVTAAWAAAIYVLNLGAFHEVLLKRDMRFGVTTFIETTSMFVGMIVAILAASLGAGYWALVLEIGIIGLGRSAGAWMACPWRPPARRPRTPGADPAPEMVGFGRNLAGVRIARWMREQTDRVLIGFLGGAHLLGLYDGSRRWTWLPTQEMDLTLSDVAISSFSRAQDRPATLEGLVRGAVSALLLFSLPVTAYFFIEPEGSVRLLFGDRWLDAVPFVRLVAFGAFFAAFARPTRWIFVSLGRTRRQFRWGLVNTGVMLGSLLIGSIWGVLGVARGFAFAHAVMAFPTIWFCLRGTSLPLGDYLDAAGRPALASGVAAVAAVAAIQLFGDIGTAARMTVEFAVLSAVYVMVWVALPGGRRAGRDGWAFVQELARGVGARRRASAAPAEASVTGD
ncbi:MAG: oligosaccharide flippase family protein [Gemmatimonadota bacterium]|nr:oligosaccharide flippase family protein [Gemmatimonadota bacterium]